MPRIPTQDMNGTVSFFSRDCVRSLGQIPRKAAWPDAGFAMCKLRMNEMARTAATKARSAVRAPGRSGRPPNELAGEVEERILDAARKVFLNRGFEGASIEEIAGVARSGKPTIYARFRDKKALFTAAVAGYVIAKQGRFENYSPSGTTIGERLANIGVTVLQEALTAEWIDLL